MSSVVRKYSAPMLQTPTKEALPGRVQPLQASAGTAGERLPAGQDRQLLAVIVDIAERIGAGLGAFQR